MKPLIQPLAERWRRLQPRERRLAGWGGAILIAAALFAADDWQRQERRRLEQALPAAEARLAAMQQMADEWSTGQPSGAPAVAMPAAAIAESLNSRGLPLTVAVTGSFELKVSGVAAFDDWLDWLAVAAAQGWRVERTSVRRGRDAAGLVTIEATLAAAGR